MVIINEDWRTVENIFILCWVQIFQPVCITHDRRRLHSNNNLTRLRKLSPCFFSELNLSLSSFVYIINEWGPPGPQTASHSFQKLTQQTCSENSTKTFLLNAHSPWFEIFCTFIPSLPGLSRTIWSIRERIRGCFELPKVYPANSVVIVVQEILQQKAYSGIPHSRN